MGAAFGPTSLRFLKPQSFVKNGDVVVDAELKQSHRDLLKCLLTRRKTLDQPLKDVKEDAHQNGKEASDNSSEKGQETGQEKEKKYSLPQ